MSKKIHTIQSSDKKEFDKEVNQFLEYGCELMDGGYQVINDDDGVVYSQVIVFNKNCEVEFYENGQKKSVHPYKDGKRDGYCYTWYENGQKLYEGTFKDGKFDGLWTWWFPNGQKEFEGIYKGDTLVNVIGKWNEDGSVEE